jgi:hypothetical protein
MHVKPVVVLDPDGLFDPLREQVTRLVDLGFARASVWGAVSWVHSVDDAFAALEGPAPTLPPAPADILEAEP